MFPAHLREVTDSGHISAMLAVSGVDPNVLIPDSKSLKAQTHCVNTAARWSQDDKGGASISE